MKNKLAKGMIIAVVAALILVTGFKYGSRFLEQTVDNAVDSVKTEMQMEIDSLRDSLVPSRLDTFMTDSLVSMSVLEVQDRWINMLDSMKNNADSLKLEVNVNLKK